MTLYRGVYPVKFAVEERGHATLKNAVIALLERNSVVEIGDTVILTKGNARLEGSTNTLKIVRVGDVD